MKRAITHKLNTSINLKIKNVMKKIIGITVLIIVFAGLFLATAKSTSLKDALIIWGCAILLSGVIVGAVYLIVD